MHTQSPDAHSVARRADDKQARPTALYHPNDLPRKPAVRITQTSGSGGTLGLGGGWPRLVDLTKTSDTRTYQTH